jgi:hypothetical protein
LKETFNTIKSASLRQTPISLQVTTAYFEASDTVLSNLVPQLEAALALTSSEDGTSLADLINAEFGQALHDHWLTMQEELDGPSRHWPDADVSQKLASAAEKPGPTTKEPSKASSSSSTLESTAAGTSKAAKTHDQAARTLAQSQTAGTDA